MAGSPVSGQCLALAGQQCRQHRHNQRLACEGEHQVAWFTGLSQQRWSRGEQFPNERHVVDQLRRFRGALNAPTRLIKKAADLLPGPQKLSNQGNAVIESTSGMSAQFTARGEGDSLAVLRFCYEVS